MPQDKNAETLTVALIGNPNTGKSTLFGALVGIHQHVGNYPGVTVEKKTGHVEHSGRRFELIDLPGLYSLAPRSPDEMVSVDLLLGRRKDSAPVDAVVCVVDASNLQRNLYLMSQVLELGLPTVVALNMVDVAESHDIAVDIEHLQRRLGIPVVSIQANRRRGMSRLKDALCEVMDSGGQSFESPFPKPFEEEVARLGPLLDVSKSETDDTEQLPRYLVERLLLDSSGYLENALLGNNKDSSETLVQARRRLAEKDCTVPGIETTARYDWARRVLDGVVVHPSKYKVTVSDRIDRVLTHKVWGTALFALLMVVVFQSVFVWADPLMNAIETLTSAAGGWVEGVMAEGAPRSLVVDGIIAGVGGILVFLPQIMILFLFIAVLEDCGYMSRAAFLMDRLMSRVGLSGKSFIPMLSCFACAVPGIMAARVIADRHNRLTTILVAPLMTCSARLPIYTLLIGAFIPDREYLGGLLNLKGLTLVGLYVLGIVTAVLVALVLKRGVFRGCTPTFVMELPSYKWPSPRTVLYRVTQRGWLFIRCAGTLILLVSMIVWAALYYPHDPAAVESLVRQSETLEAELDKLDQSDPRRAEIGRSLAQLDNEITGEYQRQSYLGKAGRAIEPVVKPLGWDWRIGCAVIASFPAREIVVATMGVIYNLGEEVDLESEEGQTRLRQRIKSATWDGTDRPVFTVPVALSIMVFFALCAQCAATLAAIRRETNSWRWPLITFTYMTTLAYIGAFLTYQIGTWMGG